MRISKLIFGFFSKIFLLILLISGIKFFISCSSSETPSETNEGPSEIFGTYFEAPLEYSAGENPVDIVLGDFNVDNKTDILVTSPRKQNGLSTIEDGTMIFFLNNSSTSSQFPYNSSTSKPTIAEWRQDVVATDYSGDNITDLIITHTDQESIKFLNNDGNATFSDNGSVTVGVLPIKIVSGDWNSDNQTDIAVVNRDNSSVSILQNSIGVFSITQTLIVEEIPISIAKGDWDNDTDIDIAVLSMNSNLVQIYINNGSGLFNVQETTYSVGSNPFDIIAGDWNCDTKNDLAITNSGEDTLSLIYGKGSGDFESPIKINSGRGPRAIAAADFDNDSKMDFVVGHQFFLSTSGLSLLTGDFSLTLSDNNYLNGYAPPISFAASLAENGASPAELSISNVDSDSKLDVLISIPATKKLVLLSGKQFYGNLSCP